MRWEKKVVGPSSLIVYHPGPEEATVVGRNRKRLPAFCLLCSSCALQLLHCTPLHCSCPVLSCWADGIWFGATIHKLQDMGRRHRAHVSGGCILCVVWN